MTATTTSTPTVREDRWRAMGSDAHVLVVDGPAPLLEEARRRVEELESRWSRFRPDSEICRLNRAAGRPVLCSPDTSAAVRAAVDAWGETHGAFDPTVLPAVVAAGYDHDFETSARGPRTAPPVPTPGCAEIAFDPVVGAITLPRSVALDLGGIGKGLAADLVTAMLLQSGAAGACVNLGGDLRASGRPPRPGGWVVGLEHAPELRVAIADGAVATSASTRRRWSVDGVEQHHLIDPRSGAPSIGDLRAVTIVADRAAHAEVIAKAAFVAGTVARAADVAAAAGVTGLFITGSDERVVLPGMEAFLR